MLDEFDVVEYLIICMYQSLPQKRTIMNMSKRLVLCDVSFPIETLHSVTELLRFSSYACLCDVAVLDLVSVLYETNTCQPIYYPN